MLTNLDLKSFKATDVIQDLTKPLRYVYSDSTIGDVQKAISATLNIPVKYQLLFNEDGHILTHGDFDIPEKFWEVTGYPNHTGKIESKREDIISSSVEAFYVINLMDLEDERPNQTTYVDIISQFWPLVTHDEYMRRSEITMSQTLPDLDSHYKAMANITMRDVEAAIMSDPVVEIFQSTVVRFVEPLDLDIVYHEILSGPDVYYRRNDHVLYTSESKPPDFMSMANENFISKGPVEIYRDRVIYKKGGKHIVSQLPPPFSDGHDSTTRTSYGFVLQLNRGRFNPISFNKIIRSIPTQIVEADLKNIGNQYSYSFFYKKSKIDDDVKRYTSFKQDGIMVVIRGSSLVTVTIKNVLQPDDLNRVFNFIVRAFVLYDRSGIAGKKPRTLNYVRGMLKIIDPVLYAPQQRSAEYKTYSRIVSLHKHPIILTHNSKIRKARYGHLHHLDYKNFTRPSTTSIYIAPHPKYPFFQLRHPSEHPLSICTVSCSVKDNRGKKMYKKCMEAIPFSTGKTSLTESIGKASNLFYIGNFNVHKSYRADKLIKMPNVLDKLFNTFHHIDSNITIKNKPYYLSVGTDNDLDFFSALEYAKLPQPPRKNMEEWALLNHYINKKYNIIILHYNHDNISVNIQNTTSKAGILKFLRDPSYKTIVILNVSSRQFDVEKYFVVGRVVLKERRNYERTFIFNHADKMTQTIANIFSKLVDDQEEYEFLMLKDLIAAKIPFKQIRVRHNIINLVKIRGVVFPIVTSFIDLSQPYENVSPHPIPADKNMKDVANMVALINRKVKRIHLTITQVVQNKEHEYEWFILNNEYFVNFKPSRKMLVHHRLPVIIMHFDIKSLKVDPRYSRADWDSPTKKTYDAYVYRASYVLNTVKAPKPPTGKVGLVRELGIQRHEFLQD